MSVNPIVAVAVIAVWLYILSVLTRAKLYAWKFMWGSFGLFLIMMITIFIHTGVTQATLLIDFECSGIIEIMAFISLLAFFNVYNFSEKVMVGIGGFCYIMLCNALRIVMICMSVYFWGMGAYYVVHTFIGRIFFYVLSVYLYFYVFTKPQVIKMKVGSFSYGNNKTNS